MAKRKAQKLTATNTEAPSVNNFVAKHMNTFNKSKVERDRTKYRRTDKHKVRY